MPNDRVRLAGVFATFLLVAALGSSSVTFPVSSATNAVAVKGISRSIEPGSPGIDSRAGVAEVRPGAALTRVVHGSQPVVPGATASFEPPPSEPARSEPPPAEPPAPLYVADDGEEIDADRIRRFLEGRRAPLAEHAEELVRAGVEHDVDPRLVVGIAVAESAGGERLPSSTHNAWGWSGDGPHGLESWSSWPAAIDGFTERFARLYDTERVDESMARTYVPPNWRWWLETVTWVMEEI
ncbi:MAG: hypothetical protein WED12_05440 [Chloroflexota bacterium]